MSPIKPSEIGDHGLKGRWAQYGTVTVLGVMLVMFYFGGVKIMDMLEGAISRLDTVHSTELNWLRDRDEKNRDLISRAMEKMSDETNKAARIVSENTSAIQRLTFELRSKTEIP